VILDWGLNPLEASTIPLGYQGGGMLVIEACHVPMLNLVKP